MKIHRDIDASDLRPRPADSRLRVGAPKRFPYPSDDHNGRNPSCDGSKSTTFENRHPARRRLETWATHHKLTVEELLAKLDL